MVVKDERYIKHRKKNLKELRNLVYERDKINTQIRKIRKDLNAWDNALISE